MAIQWMAVAVVMLLTATRGLSASEYCMADDPSCVGDDVRPSARSSAAQTAAAVVAPTDPAETMDTYRYRERREYNREGVALASKGQLQEGLELFRAAAYHEAHRRDVWANIGLALRDLALENAALTRLQALQMLREAREAFELAVWLGDKQSAELLPKLLETFKTTFPKKCLANDCPRYQVERKAFAALEAGNVEEAAKLLCWHPDNLTVTFTSEDRAGPIATNTHRRFFVIMQVCGVSVVKDVFPRRLVRTIHEATEAHWNDWDALLRENAAQNQGDRGDRGDEEFTDAASRSKDRYEVRFPLEEPYIDTQLVANRLTLALLKPVLGNRDIWEMARSWVSQRGYTVEAVGWNVVAVQSRPQFGCLCHMPRFEIDTFSYVASRAGAPDQPWHADVSQLYFRWVNHPSRQLPAAGVVLIAPLLNMTMETGPTEFMMGSHFPTAQGWKGFDETNAPVPIHRLPADVGSCILFNVQLYHRGTANRSGKMRPIVYSSYAREWWFDRVNFKDKQTRSYDALSSAQKRLFTRLDTRDYVRRLEAALQERGVDLTTFQSKGGYKKNDLEL